MTVEESESQVAVVTGAASGVGQAVMRRFARAGVRVAAVDIEKVELSALDEAARSKVLPLKADVRDYESMANAVSAATDRFGRIDIVAAIAGVMRLGRVVDMHHGERDRVFSTNFLGVWNTVQAALPAVLVSPGPRRILVCGSIASRVAAPGQAAYVSTKHALEGFVKVVALEHARDGVTVNLLSPASVETELLASNYGDTQSEFIKNTPVGRLCTPEEVAALFEFMSGAESGYITGENIVMDGGCKVINVHNLSSV